MANQRLNKDFRTAGAAGFLFIVLLFLVRVVDVAAIGPAGTSVGLSHLNNTVHQLFGFHLFWFTLTEGLGFAAIAVACVFAVVGLLQLIQRRSLAKVDRQLLALGCLYLAVILIYFFFEKVIINYRPVIMPGYDEPEASFPSSHTMAVCVILGSAAMLMDRYIRDRNLRTALELVCAFLMCVIVIGRLVSGVHWFTDILAGVLISIALLSVFRGVLKMIGRDERRRRSKY